MGGEVLIFVWLAIMVIVVVFGALSLWQTAQPDRFSSSPTLNEGRPLLWWGRQAVKLGLTLFALY
jgi:hypothetical protein